MQEGSLGSRPATSLGNQLCKRFLGLLRGDREVSTLGGDTCQSLSHWPGLWSPLPGSRLSGWRAVGQSIWWAQGGAVVQTVGEGRSRWWLWERWRERRRGPAWRRLGATSLQPRRVAALLLLLLLEPEAWERDALPRAPRCLAALVEWQHWLGQSAMRCPPSPPKDHLGEA